jgi:quercetin dioxygenase-like cupin family protein
MKILIAGLLSVGATFFCSPMDTIQNVPPGKMVIMNAVETKWQHDAGDPAGSQTIVLREDPRTQSVELLARYPAGHVFPPHWHSANERILLLEGRLSIQNENTAEYLDPGGFAYLPATQPQKMACVSRTRCSFYVYWDGKLDFHKVEGK